MPCPVKHSASIAYFECFTYCWIVLPDLCFTCSWFSLFFILLFSFYLAITPAQGYDFARCHVCALIQARCRCRCQCQCQSQFQLQLQLQLRSQLWSMAKRVQHELFNGLGMPCRGHVRRRHLAECVPGCVCVCQGVCVFVPASVCECPLISFACRPFIKAKSDGTHNNAQWAKNRKNQTKVKHWEREREREEAQREQKQIKHTTCCAVIDEPEPEMVN